LKNWTVLGLSKYGLQFSESCVQHWSLLGFDNNIAIVDDSYKY